MEARADFLHRLREHAPHLHIAHRRATSGRLVTVGLVSGVVGGLAMGAPLVIYDWAKSGHSALELPMATTAWVFGFDRFARNGYHWWPIVIGALFLLAYWAVTGLAFAGLADRVYGLRSMNGSLALGLAWSVVSFLFFWDMLLPIARDGAPFRPSAVAPGQFVAPNRTWILGFTLLGVASGTCYRGLRVSEAAPATTTTTTQQAA